MLLLTSRLESVHLAFESAIAVQARVLSGAVEAANVYCLVQ